MTADDNADKINNTISEFKEIGRQLMSLRDRAKLAGDRWSAFSWQYNEEVDSNDPAKNSITKVVLAKPFVVASEHNGTDPDKLSNIIGSNADFIAFMNTHDDNFIFALR